MLSKILQSLGLTEKEAKVYLANLEIGTSVVSEIGKKAKINRVTTYDILQKLTQKALVSSFTKNKLKYFTAEDPEKVFAEYQKRIKNLEESLPELKRLTGETKHAKVRYFEGIEGIKKIYEDTLTAKTELLNYANSAEIRNHWPDYDEEYVAKRHAKKIYLKGIAPLDELGIKVQSESPKFHREIRLVPGEQYNFTNEINIYDDKVAIISFNDELIGTIIESPSIANTQRAIFNMAWEFASSFSKNTAAGLGTVKPPKAEPQKAKPKKSQPVVAETEEVPDSPPLKDQVAMF